MRSLLVLLSFMLFAFAACSPGSGDLAANAPAAVATQLEVTLETPTAEPTADPEIGEVLFNKKYLETSGRQCHFCHKVQDSDVTPLVSLIGIAKTAGERVEGLSAEAYLRQSILNPTAYQVDGFSEHCPDIYGEIMSEEEINHVIAYMMTLE